MRKFFTFAAAITMAICLMSCSAGSGNPSAPTSASAPDTTADASPVSADSPDPSAVPTAPPPKPGTLTVYLGQWSSTLTPMINMFAKANPDITVDFQTDDGSAIAVEMMSGNAPDLICDVNQCGTADYSRYGERGLLTDFKTLMANDPDFDASQYVGSALKSTENADGSMYAFPFGFQYVSFISVNTSAPASVVSNFTSRKGISLEDMLQTYAGLPGESGLKISNEFCNDQGVIYLNLYTGIESVYPSYVNSAGKTCDFTNPAFIQTMKYMKAFQTTKTNTVYYDPSNDSATAKQYLYFCDNCFEPQYFLPYDSNHFTQPIPLTDKNGNVCVYDRTFSIYNGSPNKDIAWELIKYLTGSTNLQFQTVSGRQLCPVLLKAIPLAQTNSISNMISYEAGQGNTLPIDTQTAAQNVLTAYTAFSDMPMVDLGGQDRALGSIVLTEFENFMSAATTAEQAAANMQNKAELYLNE